MSGYSPWWRRLLQRHAGFLFRVCPEGNYHWRHDKLCYCGIGGNGQTDPVRLR